ncbi:MAG: hypothetical protein KJO07_16395, partial [Deltaproteobacteria bacterium]|nr:hypothetical protein [Deltaproteobacteria bacterium]
DSYSDDQIDESIVDDFFQTVLPIHLTGHTGQRASIDLDGVPPEVRAAFGPEADYQSNAMDMQLTPEGVLSATEDGQLSWAPAAGGMGWKAGGPDGTWVTVTMKASNSYVMAVTRGTSIVGMPIQQKNGWFSKCALHKLWRLLEDGAY